MQHDAITATNVRKQVVPKLKPSKVSNGPMDYWVNRKTGRKGLRGSSSTQGSATPFHIVDKWREIPKVRINLCLFVEIKFRFKDSSFNSFTEWLDF